MGVCAAGGGGDNREVKNGKYEEQKDHRFGKRSLGFLLLFVLVAVGQKA